MNKAEFDVLARLAERLPAAPAGSGELWIGDDAAVLAGGLLVTNDVLVHGLDWRDDWSSPADVGWKSVMVNVSDIAAMGGRTDAILVGLVVADGFDIDGFYDGVTEACAAAGCSVVGGDLSGGDQTVVSVTALGRTDRAVTRSGARPGDGVFVSGRVGAAARDLRNGGGPAHRRPTAYLGQAPGIVTAMIDVSDGFVADCAHIAAASGLRIDLDAVPLADGATVEDGLHGGDDYVLVATAGVAAIEGWVRVGACAAGVGVTWQGDPIEPHGWEHSL
ncbi:MAG: AIR synthase related protein [Acidimicrobiales bacterium]|nr:AIR synthase related protein [Acidimicrobiales bacterium]